LDFNGAFLKHGLGLQIHNISYYLSKVLRHSSHPWHLARPPAAAALACFFKEQEASGS